MCSGRTACTGWYDFAKNPCTLAARQMRKNLHGIFAVWGLFFSPSQCVFALGCDDEVAASCFLDQLGGYQTFDASNGAGLIRFAAEQLPAHLDGYARVGSFRVGIDNREHGILIADLFRCNLFLGAGWLWKLNPQSMVGTVRIRTSGEGN
jgi:hypothetical protein